jgi:hypothetical protein
MTCLNIQIPWSLFLIDGLKSVETRSYPLPKKYEGVELALIETPGKSGSFKSRIIGTITFSHCFKYPDINAWKDDYNRHLVEEANSLFCWNDKDKYGWVVSNIRKFDEPVSAPKKKGIIFTKNCKVSVDSCR